MDDLFDLPGVEGLEEDKHPLLRNMLASILIGESAKHGKTYADLVLYILITYDLRKRCQDADAMIGAQDGAWFDGCNRGLRQLLQRHIEASGLSDPEIDKALMLADRLWKALRAPDAAVHL